jgi:pyruvate/2-oxoglutarate dehydrogenase complex dihydrolipoamide acyltransferase (E2) component
MPTKVIMPQLGESVVEGTVSKWLKEPGDTVAEFDALLEVNTDKVDTEIPSPAAGTLLGVLVPAGETVKAGTVLAWIGEPGEEIPAGNGGAGEKQKAGAKKETTPAVTEPAAAHTPARPERDLGFISPVVARIAQEQAVDLSQVTGTGQGGRITKKDVLKYLETRPAETTPAAWETPGEGDLFRPTELVFGQATPAASSSQKPGDDEVIPHSSMRKTIAEHMVASKRTAPHVTTVMEADMKRVVAHREANKGVFARDGVNLTYTAYFAAAAIAALKTFPVVNSSWTEEALLIHPDIHLGIAVSLGADGLIVPVIRHADGLSLLGLARALNDFSERARSRRLGPDEVRGGTFTITNHGVSGSLFATPVINQPQTAILGVGAIQKRAVVLGDDAIAVRPMVYLSLTFDHRILDGVSADGFLAKVVETLEAWPG